jgi:hypothetical protein
MRMNMPRQRKMKIKIAHHHPPAGAKDQSYLSIDAIDSVPCHEITS